MLDIQDIDLSIIVAMAKNRVIGADNKLLWHLPEDLKRFKAITRNKVCIMGRKTYESIVDVLGKPLPKRLSIVITRNTAYKPIGAGVEDVIICHSLGEAIDIAKEKSGERDQNEVFCLGGAQIYTEFLQYANRIYLTELDKTYYGDAYFPQINMDEWELCGEERGAFSGGSDSSQSGDTPRYMFRNLERRIAEI